MRVARPALAVEVGLEVDPGNDMEEMFVTFATTTFTRHIVHSAPAMPDSMNLVSGKMVLEMAAPSVVEQGLEAEIDEGGNPGGGACLHQWYPTMRIAITDSP